MNKRDRVLSLFLATVSCLGIASMIVPTSLAIANPTSECYMIDELGQLIDLSYLCNPSFHTKQATIERSSLSLDRTTSTTLSSVVEQSIPGINYTTSVPWVYTNSLPIGFSVGSTSYLPTIFAGSIPIGYESFSNLAYTIPRFWVRSFQESAASRSGSFSESPTLINFLQQGKPLIFIERYE